MAPRTQEGTYVYWFIIKHTTQHQPDMRYIGQGGGRRWGCTLWYRYQVAMTSSDTKPLSTPMCSPTWKLSELCPLVGFIEALLPGMFDEIVSSPSLLPEGWWPKVSNLQPCDSSGNWPPSWRYLGAEEEQPQLHKLCCGWKGLMNHKIFWLYPYHSGNSKGLRGSVLGNGQRPNVYFLLYYKSHRSPPSFFSVSTLY